MTERKKNVIFKDKILLLLAFLFLTGLFIKNSGLAAEYVRSALSLCANTVIPSVFPCAVLSGIFIALGGGELIAKMCARPMKWLFGISGGGATVLFLGWFCGFPVGAAAGAALLKRGALSEDELAHLMLFSNIPSPAFVIGAVGNGMLESRHAGVWLYFILLAVSFATGVLIRRFAPRSFSEHGAQKPDSYAHGIASAIGSAASSMISLCASVVFFSVLTEVLLSVLGGISGVSFLSALIGGIFELSGGCAAAAELCGKQALGLCAFILGWSGLCVHFQIISASGMSKKLPLYFTVKLLQGLACAALSLVLPVTV